jgi:hypothetical protein
MIRVEFVTTQGCLQRLVAFAARRKAAVERRSISSYAGLTRVSIDLRKMHFSKKMDCRVKPGNDENVYSAACCAIVGVVPATVARRMSRGCDWS